MMPPTCHYHPSTAQQPADGVDLSERGKNGRGGGGRRREPPPSRERRWGGGGSARGRVMGWQVGTRPRPVHWRHMGVSAGRSGGGGSPVGRCAAPPRQLKCGDGGRRSRAPRPGASCGSARGEEGRGGGAGWEGRRDAARPFQRSSPGRAAKVQDSTNRSRGVGTLDTTTAAPAGPSFAPRTRPLAAPPRYRPCPVWKRRGATGRPTPMLSAKRAARRAPSSAARVRGARQALATRCLGGGRCRHSPPLPPRGGPPYMSSRWW